MTTRVGRVKVRGLMLDGLQLALVGSAAIAAGAVNALAGGGTLITFPLLTAMGIPPVVANVTNTVALCPGYLGATWAQRAEIASQRKRLWILLPVGFAGGLLGGLLLLNTGEKIFRELIPWLILMASGLLAAQDPLRNWLMKRSGHAGSHSSGFAIAPVMVGAVYGGYFGAGASVIVLAVLGLVYSESLTILNGLKQAFSLCVNVAAALFFLFSGHVLWPIAAVMAVGALAGGAMGGKLAGVIRPSLLRWIVVTIGVIISIIYFVS